MPDLDLPLPSTLNPFADEVIEHTLRWVVDVGLFPDRADAAVLERDRVLHAGPRLVPNASLSQASLVSDWTIFLIVVGEVAAGAQPAVAGIARALADIDRRCERMAPSSEWLARFSRLAREHIASKAVEVRERAAAHVLGLEEYVSLRRVSGAPYTYAALVELTEQVRIPAIVRACAEWDALLDAFADTFIGIEDVCSCAGAAVIGDVVNVAAVLQVAHGGSPQAALDAADDWLDGRVRAFEGAVADLPDVCMRCSLDTGVTESVLEYADALALTLGGHLAWSRRHDARGPRS